MNKKLTDVLHRYTAEIEAVVRANILEDIRHGLATPATAGRSSRHIAAAEGAGKGVKRSQEVLAQTVKQLHSYIVKHPGQRIEQIAEGMRRTTRELNLPIKKLIAGKHIATKGEKRATTYAPR